MPLPVQVALAFTGVSPERMNEIAHEEALASAKRLEQMVVELYKSRVMAGITGMKPQDELTFYLLVTNWHDAAVMLVGGDYGDRVRNGEAPKPQVVYQQREDGVYAIDYWQRLMLVPPVATLEAARFKELYERYVLT